MNKILLSLLTIFLSTLFISCAKVPFIESSVKKDAALVYVYAIRKADSIDVGTRIQVYKISINGKTTKGFIKGYEYVKYDLKSGPIKFTASRNDVEKHMLDLNLEEGKTYYIRLNSFGEDWGEFNFKLVNESQALKELQDTTLAGAYNTEDSVISALIPADEEKKVIKGQASQSTKEAPKTSTSKTGTKLDDIKNAYEMKKEGLLTEEEFKAMKAEILAK